MAKFDIEKLLPLQTELAQHPIYDSLRTVEDLRVFMNHHVYSVWDFMSLVKYLQRHITPTAIPWMPQGDPQVRAFINQLVLEEESDTAPTEDGNPVCGSHFEYYCGAMAEVGADNRQPLRFLDAVREQGTDAALGSGLIPLPARCFSETTFGLIREDRPHEVASALALGRERVVPGMFRRFLRETGVSERQAPGFHYYLKRHVKLDEGLHAPLALRLLENLCADDPNKIAEAEAAAEESMCARIRFWDGVLDAIETARSA